MIYFGTILIITISVTFLIIWLGVSRDREK
jgi:hypothetical protein